MKYLTIRFIDSYDVISKLITWTTNSLWCHTEALSRDGQSWIGAHAGTGVQARPLNWCKPTRELTYAIPVDDSQYEAAMFWLESKIGYPYDYEDIVGLAIHKRIFRKSSIICSTLMFVFITKTGIIPLNCLTNYSFLLTPETLHLAPIFIGKSLP